MFSLTTPVRLAVILFLSEWQLVGIRGKSAEWAWLENWRTYWIHLWESVSPNWNDPKQLVHIWTWLSIVAWFLLKFQCGRQPTVCFTKMQSWFYTALVFYNFWNKKIVTHCMHLKVEPMELYHKIKECNFKTFRNLSFST